MEGTVADEQKKDLSGKDNSNWESEACGLIYKGGDCCLNSCVFTSDHYHCQGCGIGTAEVSQALAHVRTSQGCRKDSLVHYSASPVGMTTDPTNSLYSAIYNGFTSQNSYSAPSFSSFGQMDSFQWHPTMSDKVAICSTQLSPCCSSNGGTYIPVESQLCSPISDLYSKVTAPIRDLVSLPAKSSGSAIDQPWFAAYNPQQIPKNGFKFSDQNPPPQISFILLDPSDQKHQEIGETSTNMPTNFCSKSDISGKDIHKESYCAYTSQPLPGMLSEDALFSLQLQDETLKQADLQQQSVSQILLSDVNLPGKNIPPVENMATTSRVDTHFTQEHFGQYMSSCSAYSSQIQDDNNLENQPSSAASDSDESDIIVEDTGDDLGSQMTESEIFIEDIKCSLLQGVEDENSSMRNSDVLRDKSGVVHPRQDIKSCGTLQETKMQAESQIKSCMSSYHTLLKCVVCEKSVSDGNPGSVLVQMNNQMPLTTSSHTPVLTKLNEVVAIEVTDFLDVNGKFMCQSCFKLVDTVDSLESKLESLKQDIAALIKTGSKPLIIRHNPCAKLAVDLLEPNQSTIMNVSSKVKGSSNSGVHELLQDSIIETSSAEKSVRNTEHGLGNNVEQRDYLLLSGRALSLANSIDKVSLSLGQHHPVELVVQGEPCVAQPPIHVTECNVPKISDVSPSHYQINSVDSILKERETISSHVGNYIASHGNQETVLSCTENRKQIYHLAPCEKTGIKLSKIRRSENPNMAELRAPHSSECTMENCHEILRLEQKLQENPQKILNTFEKYACNLCCETFASNDLLGNHQAKFPETDPSLCEVCGQLFHNQIQLDDHLFKIHYIYQKHCELCGVKVHHPCMYEVHMRDHPDGKVILSSTNADTFSVGVTLPTSSGFMEKNFAKCDSCDQAFSSLSYLENHIKTKHAPKKILSKCDQCDRSYTKPSDLQAHRRSHSNAKNFECKICGRRYKSLGNLNHHAKTHDVKKPYTCEICSQGFIRKDFFETHINSHKDNKPYKCEKCNKGFLSKSYLQVHLKWHLDKIKKVTCPICHKTYSQRLNVHMRSHTGERPHPCIECPKRFITGSALRKHMKRIHKANTPEDACSGSEDSDPAPSDSDDRKSPLSCPE